MEFMQLFISEVCNVDLILVILACLAIGAAISGIIMMIVRSKLKSVKAEHSACNYTRSGSFKTKNQSDIFLFNSITRIPIPRNTK